MYVKNMQNDVLNLKKHFLHEYFRPLFPMRQGHPSGATLLYRDVSYAPRTKNIYF